MLYSWTFCRAKFLVQKNGETAHFSDLAHVLHFKRYFIAVPHWSIRKCLHHKNVARTSPSLYKRSAVYNVPAKWVDFSHAGPLAPVGFLATQSEPYITQSPLEPAPGGGMTPLTSSRWCRGAAVFSSIKSVSACASVRKNACVLSTVSKQAKRHLTGNDRHLTLAKTRNDKNYLKIKQSCT